MNDQTQFNKYQPKTILNRHKHPDHWFWTRYSVHPYIGCQHGCFFCYSRETKYSPYDSPDEFSRTIKVKENAAALLRRALTHKPVDLVFCCDYQPAERKFGISRQILEVCLDMGFPVFILERSPLVLRDLDLLIKINQQTPSVVAFSIISTPDSPNHNIASRMENLAPKVEQRFKAMREFADAGILTGTCFMPVLPGICDDTTNINAVVRWTADNGGQFVLAGGLTLADKQKDYFYRHLERISPDLMDSYRHWYPNGSYEPSNYNWNQIAQQINIICKEFGIRDRIPRPIIAGDKFTLNKRIAERLADTSYHIEIYGGPQYKIWAYRKAAWAIEEINTDIGLVYKSLGLSGLQSIQDVGEKMGFEVEKLINELSAKIPN